jgi:PAS domain S-box-containing protein
VMLEHRPIEFQTESVARPGRWLEVRAFPTRHGVGVAFKDESERRRTAEDLRYQLDLTRSFTDNTAEALFLMDEEGRVSFMNPAAERMFGFSAEEMMGQVLHDLLHHHHPDGRPFPMAECPLGRVFENGQGLKLHDDVFFRKDGSPIPVACSNTPVFKDGRVVGAALVVRDVTERNRREAALRESEARFRHMADSVPALIWMTDQDGRIIFANMHYDHMFGRPAAEMHGRGWIDIVLPDDQASFEAAFLEAFRERLPFQSEVRVRDGHGRVRWLRCEGVPRLDDGGTFLGYTGCNVDITDVRTADERQRLLINELNHRVKNTLATVQSIAMQTLRNARSPGQARLDFEVRLFALSRAHDVLTRENWQGAHLYEIAEGAIEPYRHRGTSRFRIKGPDLRLPPRMALAIAMALHELVTNAVKYGALSNDTGKVDMAWTALDEAGNRRLIFRWSESGGPPVQPPSRRGFGSRLIERSLAQDLGGEVKVDFAPTGVVCTLDAPLDGA